MEKTGQFVSARNISPIPNPKLVVKAKSVKPPDQNSKNGGKQDRLPLRSKKHSRAPRRLISISHGGSRWDDKWSADLTFSLQDLQLADLVEDDKKDTEVFINLTVTEHASVGFSVDGRVMTSMDLTCTNCCCTYQKKIDEGFRVWVLPSRRRDNRKSQMPVIGGDDPSVIYVKPGQEADLDSVVQETIRLEAWGTGTCSESCANSEPREFYI